MREYVLMTDSCCDLPDQMARELQLEVLPLTMHMDGQDYPNTLDGAAISNEEFYRRIRAGKMATTSAVNVGQFEDAMSAVLAGGGTFCASASPRPCPPPTSPPASRRRASGPGTRRGASGSSTPSAPPWARGF